MQLSYRVMAHFKRPTHAGSLDRNDPAVVAINIESRDRGDVIRLQVRLDSTGTVLEEVRFRAMGCPSLIAAADLAAEWMEGKSLDDAPICSVQIAAALDLPQDKLHSAHLAAEAVRTLLDACNSRTQAGSDRSAARQSG